MAGLLRQGTSLTRRNIFQRFSLRPTSAFISGSSFSRSGNSHVPVETSGVERQYATSSENAAAKELYNRQRQIMALEHKVPDVAVDAFVAPNAVLIGDVIVEDRAVVWYGSILRGDLNHIRLGAYSNIGSKTVVHAARTSPTELSAETTIGKYVTIGSQCSLRSCSIEDEVVIGHKCVLMEGSLVEKHAILGDNSVLPPGRRIPGGQLWAGNPVRYVRSLTSDEKAEIARLADGVYREAGEHAEEFLPYSTAYLEAEKLKKALTAPAS